jgi:hypothetical protein
MYKMAANKVLQNNRRKISKTGRENTQSNNRLIQITQNEVHWPGFERATRKQTLSIHSPRIRVRKLS